MIMTARTRSTDGIDGKDAVGLYLDAIAKTPLLSAEEEVQLAHAIEAGLFAREILDGNETTSTDATRDELEQLVELGNQAMQPLRRTCAWWSPWPASTVALRCRCSTWCRRATPD